MGQNDSFAHVVPQVRGHFSCCPCRVGTYDSIAIHMFTEGAIVFLVISSRIVNCSRHMLVWRVDFSYLVCSVADPLGVISYQWWVAVVNQV